MVTQYMFLFAYNIGEDAHLLKLWMQQILQLTKLQWFQKVLIFFAPSTLYCISHIIVNQFTLNNP